jgi:tetratricopeptide (TPR) repeat protein
MILVLLRSQGLIVQLPRPMAASVVLLFSFHLICRLALLLADKIQKNFKIEYPSLSLWLYPTLTMFGLALFSLLFITLTHHFFGRGFYSNLLQLNSQETTSFFSTCFMTLILFTCLLFFHSTIQTLSWIAGTTNQRINKLDKLGNNTEKKNGFENELSDAIASMKKETDFLQTHRTRASKINRFALLTIFCIMLLGSCWIIFFRPAIVLFYRAEIQLRTFIEPLAAYETLKHLANRFPTYRYMDTVRFRMAWILDRRLQKLEQASKEYQDFIKTFPESVWTDEAIANLVRITVDNLHHYEKAINLINQFLKKYPRHIFAPHMHIYKIRALARQNKLIEARKAIESARAKFSDQEIQIINSEDRLIELLSFSEALAAEISANPDLQ